MSNVLVALKNIIDNPYNDLLEFYKGSNRANNMGDALELYIKDLFCNSFGLTNLEKDRICSEEFSYLGNQNNPPDLIIKGSDAIEVKKIESINSAIALNSSFPKDVLHFNDTRITEECRKCEIEKWEQKDIIYTIGVAPKNVNKLKVLWFVYGNCYAASSDVYSRISSTISDGINGIAGVEFVQTNELAKVKKVDPLGITDLRVRGMWHIANPIKVFADYIEYHSSNEFSVYALMLEDKYLSFPESDRIEIENIKSDCLIIKSIEIKSPNNPAKLLKARLISYVR